MVYNDKGLIGMKPTKEVFQDIGYSYIGIELVIATVVGTFIGYRLDLYFHTRPWLMLLGILVGAVAGFRNIFRLLNSEQDIKKKS